MKDSPCNYQWFEQIGAFFIIYFWNATFVYISAYSVNSGIDGIGIDTIRVITSCDFYYFSLFRIDKICYYTPSYLPHEAFLRSSAPDRRRRAWRAVIDAADKD